MSETLTTEQVEELLAGCEGATPGPWGEGDKWVFASPRDGNPSSALENILRNEEAQANAAHIARLDPQTVSSLATELLALRKRVGELEGAIGDTVEIAGSPASRKAMLAYYRRMVELYEAYK